MKRLCLLILCIFSLMLTACGGQADQEKLDEFKSQLSQRETVSFTADIRCEYPDKTHEFSLYYEGGTEGSTVKVLSPKMIAGVSAEFSPDGTSLNFGETSVDTGNLDEYGLSPMSALPSLVNLMKNGFMESSWEEADFSVYELSLNDNLSAQIWFNSLNMVPVKAELISNGTVKVFCNIDNWLKIME